MNSKFILYALFVTFVSTATSWTKMFSGATNSGGGGSSWSSGVGGGGGSYGGGSGGSGHK